MRRAEVAQLKIADIDSQRMIIHVVDGKGHKDRDLPLSPALLENTACYWRWLKHAPTCFHPVAIATANSRISDKVIWLACTNAAKKAGIHKKSNPHLIRHSWATHLLKPAPTCAPFSCCSAMRIWR